MVIDNQSKAPSLEAGLIQFWRRHGAPKRLILAVSGGSDSMALMRGASVFNQESVDLLVVTIDHGLRPEADHEAGMVAKWAAANDLCHKVLKWDGVKPETGMQESARNARYRLLAEEAVRGGYGAIMTAHTANDVAETMVMRLARGSGLGGLAAMADTQFIANGANAPVALWRPFLSETREGLQNYLACVGQPFVTDPSNDDPAFERVRMRAFLASSSVDAGLSPDALALSAKRLRAAHVAQKQAEEQAFRYSNGVFAGWGGVFVRRTALMGAFGASLAARLIYAVSGERYGPAIDKVEDSFSELVDNKRTTLSGAMMESAPDGVWFYREAAAVTGRAGKDPLSSASLKPGQRILWDGRFIIENNSSDLWRIQPAGRLTAESSGRETAGALFSGPRGGWPATPAVLAETGDLWLAPQYRPNSVKSLTAERFFQQVNRF